MPLAVRDGPHDGKRGAFIAERVSYGVDLLVRRSEEDGRLYLVERTRAEREHVSGAGRVQKDVEAVRERIERICRLAVCSCVQRVWVCELKLWGSVANRRLAGTLRRKSSEIMPVEQSWDVVISTQDVSPVGICRFASAVRRCGEGSKESEDRKERVVVHSTGR